MVNITNGKKESTIFIGFIIVALLLLLLLLLDCK